MSLPMHSAKIINRTRERGSSYLSHLCPIIFIFHHFKCCPYAQLFLFYVPTPLYFLSLAPHNIIVVCLNDEGNSYGSHLLSALKIFCPMEMPLLVTSCFCYTLYRATKSKKIVPPSPTSLCSIYPEIDSH